MPWQESSVADERLRFVVLASRKERSMSGLCEEFGVSRQTGYTWLKRYQAGGAPEVFDRSRRPLHSPARTGEKIESLVVELRRQRPDWGAPKLLATLRKEHPQVPSICERTVHRILDRHDLIPPAERARAAEQRFERAAPNELWQMDFKGPQGFNSACPVGPLSILDDHSRYLIALEHLGSTRMAGVRATLDRSFRDVGVPEAMLVDHGTPWWSSQNPWGLSELSVWIMRQGVRLLFSGLRHPQTQGKVERMHGALQRAVRLRKRDPREQPWLDEFRHEYNHLRPHQGIGMITPATRWHPSAKLYEPHPRDWDYDPHQTVKRVGNDGSLSWRGRRFAITDALRGERVGIEPLGDRAVVFFCHTPMRELDLKTGRSFPIPIAVQR